MECRVSERVLFCGAWLGFYYYKGFSRVFIRVEEFRYRVLATAQGFGFRLQTRVGGRGK